MVNSLHGTERRNAKGGAEMSEWISVEDRLPSREGLELDEVEYVLVSDQSFDAISVEDRLPSREGLEPDEVEYVLWIWTRWLE